MLAIASTSGRVTLRRLPGLHAPLLNYNELKDNVELVAGGASAAFLLETMPVMAMDKEVTISKEVFHSSLRYRGHLFNSKIKKSFTQFPH